MYRTTDLYLAAFLDASGFKVVDTEGDRKKTFVFEEDEELMKEQIMKFTNREATVEARALVDAIKNFKALTYNI